jgi:hypothetical protein
MLIVIAIRRDTAAGCFSVIGGTRPIGLELDSYQVS